MPYGQPELLLNKADIDRLFSFNKVQWHVATAQMTAPGWELRIRERREGTQIVGRDPATGIALSVQPLFRNDTSPPETVIVGNYFPVGMLPPIAESMTDSLRFEAQKEIGAAYSLFLKHDRRDQLEAWEYFISEL